MAVNCGTCNDLPLRTVNWSTLTIIILCITLKLGAQDSVVENTSMAIADSLTDSIGMGNNSGSPVDSAEAVVPINQVQSAPKRYGLKRVKKSRTAQFLIGLGIFLLFGILRLLYLRYIKELVRVLSRSTLGRMTSNDAIWQNLMPRWLFLLIYFLTGGYIVGGLIAHFSTVNGPRITLWLWGVAVVFSIFLLKFLAIHAVGLVFRFNKTAVSFFNHLSVVNQLVGLILLPICGILMLAPLGLAKFMLMAAGILLCMAMILKWLINVGYVRNLSKVSYLHFILYLCIFEFIPLAVCARYVYNSIGA